MKKCLIILIIMFCFVPLISTSVFAAEDVGKVISLEEYDDHIIFYLESNRWSETYRRCYVGAIDYEGKEIADKARFALINSLTYDLVILYNYESSGGTVYPLSVDIVYSDTKIEALEERIEKLEKRMDYPSVPPLIRRNK